MLHVESHKFLLLVSSWVIAAVVVAIIATIGVGVGVGVAEGSWCCYKKELLLCQPIESGNRFWISLLSLFLALFFFLETVK